MKPDLPAGKNDPLAHQMPSMETTTLFEVTSPAFHDGENMLVRHSAYGDNFSLPLEWQPGPTGTKSYALFMEDPDASGRALPVVHWLAWNIPAGIQHLEERLPSKVELTRPKGMRQGLNVKGNAGYAGPKPPEGNPPHHYNIQIFALDSLLGLPGGAPRHELLAACQGHVLAKGILVGKFAWPVVLAGK